jgi:hypothetical protein
MVTKRELLRVHNRCIALHHLRHTKGVAALVVQIIDHFTEKKKATGKRKRKASNWLSPAVIHSRSSD